MHDVSLNRLLLAQVGDRPSKRALQVENALSGHPAVEKVAAIGVPDPKGDRGVKSFVLAAEGTEPSYEEFVAWAAGKACRATQAPAIHRNRQQPSS